MSTLSSKKLDCPFCGGRDIRSHHRGHPTSGEWVIECHNCSCELTGFGSEQQAWERWNKRPPSETSVCGLPWKLTSMAWTASTERPKEHCEKCNAVSENV